MLNVESRAMRLFHRTDRRTWSLLDEQGKLLGSRTSGGWHGRNFELLVADGLYTLRRPTAWRGDVDLVYNGTTVQRARFRWNLITISAPGSLAPKFTIRRKGWFNSSHLVLDEQGRERAEMKLRFNWSTFSTEPMIIREAGEPLPPLALLFVAHLIAIQQERAHAAAA